MRVTIDVQEPGRLDMTGLHHVLVTSLVIDQEVAEFDLNHELTGVLKRDLKSKAGLDVLDVEPPPLPEQPLRDLLANTGFWRRLADKHGADLVISGEASFKTADRSGYVQVDEISPVTGQRVRRARFVEREAFLLDLRLFFLRGATGELLYEDHFSTEQTYNGQGFDQLAGLFDLYDQIGGDVRAIVAPRRRRVQRVLFTE